MENHHHHQNHAGMPMMTKNEEPMGSMMNSDSQSEPMNHMHHSSSMSPAMDHMMKMYFHGGYEEVILFDFWRINTLGGLIGSMVACFVLGIIYEFIKSYREYWMRGAFQTVKYNQVEDSRNRSQIEQGSEINNDSQSDQGSVKFIETNMWSIAHFVLTLLHLVQMTLAYFLMLIVMTYNSWLCGAVILGSTVGYFLVGWRKTTLVDTSDHCH